MNSWRDAQVNKTDRDCCQKSLGHIGDNDSDEEDDCVEPEVAENKGDDEERDTEEDGYGSDDVNEVADLTGDRRLDRLQPAGEDRDPAHHRPVARINDHTATRTWHDDNAK